MSRATWPGALRFRDLRLFWFGETTSKFGSTVSTVAAPLVAVVVLHASVLDVSLLSAAAWVPWLPICLPAGAWIDRLPRRPVMLVCDLVSLVAFASVPVAAWAGTLSLAQLFAVALIGGAASVFFQTAYTVYLPEIVEPSQLPSANALLHGSESAAQVAGPGVAGALAATVGAVSGMLLNALSFLVSAACLRSIRAEERRPSAPPRRRALRREIAEGMRFVARDPYLSVMTVFGAVSNLGLVGYQSILVVFLVRGAHVGAGLVGALIAITSLGGVIGATLAPRIGRRLGTARAFLVCEIAVGPAALLIPLGGPGARLACVVAGGLIVAGGVVCANVVTGSWRQVYCPPALLGRISSSAQLVNYGTIPLGALLAGVIATSMGTRTSLWVMTGVVAASPALLLVRRPLRRARDLPAKPARAVTGVDRERGVRVRSAASCGT